MKTSKGEETEESGETEPGQQEATEASITEAVDKALQRKGLTEDLLNNMVEKLSTIEKELASKYIKPPGADNLEQERRATPLPGTGAASYASITGDGANSMVIMVQEATDKQNKKEADREQRDYNVVIHGVNESGERFEKLRQRDDVKYCTELCTEVLDVNVEIVNVARLGRFDPAKKRPLRVTFMDQLQARKVHINAYRLRDEHEGPYKGISITHDLTVEERDALKRMVEEAKNMTQQEETGKWEYKVRSKGPYWDPKIKKLLLRPPTHRRAGPQGDNPEGNKEDNNQQQTETETDRNSSNQE
jgi:hypothetical protein